MKKIFAVLLTLVMMFSFASVAFAASWGVADTIPSKCDAFQLTVTKYEKVKTATGDGYQINNSLIANIGDDVYFSACVHDLNGQIVLDYDVDTQGEFVWYFVDVDNANIAYEAEISTSNMRNVMWTGKTTAAGIPIFVGTVTGANPTVEIKVTSTETFASVRDRCGISVATATCAEGCAYSVDYKGLTICTNEKGKTIHYESDLNAAKLGAVLGELGMTLDGIVDGAYYMTQDNIVAHFGGKCESVASRNWSPATEIMPVAPNQTLGIPKTGDASVGMYIGAALIILGIAGGAWYVVSKRKEAAN